MAPGSQKSRPPAVEENGEEFSSVALGHNKLPSRKGQKDVDAWHSETNGSYSTMAHDDGFATDIDDGEDMM